MPAILFEMFLNWVRTVSSWTIRSEYRLQADQGGLAK